MERARKEEVETVTRESREMKLADRAESEGQVREQVREEIGKTEFRAVCGLSTFVSLHKWNCEQNLNLADHHHQNRGDHHHPHRNDLNEWFDHFKRSTIVCPSSGHPILELKFLRDGIESRYGTYFKEDRHLGTGGFRSVFKCRGLLDEQVYAVKKICIKNISFDKALRSVSGLPGRGKLGLKFYQLFGEDVVKAFDTYIAFLVPTYFIDLFNVAKRFLYGKEGFARFFDYSYTPATASPLAQAGPTL